MGAKINNTDGFNRFLELIKKYKSKQEKLYQANEAAIRLIVIDEILQILGWEKEEFSPEEYVGTAGYVDYRLVQNGIPRLVVEAKKAGETFRSSSTKLQKNEYEVRYFKRAFKSQFSEIIEQARRYCFESNVPYGVITNGIEWVVLQLIPPPGTNIDSTKGVYLGNIFSETFEFDLLWNLLSYEALTKGSLEEYLNGINYHSAETCKIIESDYNALIWKNSKKEPYISDFYEHFFSQITESNKRKMLEFCFVTNSKLEQYKGELRRVLKDTAPQFLPLDTDDFEPGESKDSILNTQNTGNVVIITGSVGCGKSTLVTKCMVEARQMSGDFSKPILIDLIHEVGKNLSDARKTIFELIYAYLQEKFSELFAYDYLKKIFHQELRIQKNGEYQELYKTNPDLYFQHEADLIRNEKSNKENFVLKALRKLTQENISVILVIDNVDRAHEDFQEQMYALSHKISSFTGVKTILTLREFTFFKNKTSGFLDVRPEDNVIHLKAPDFNKLIAKRVKYIETQFEHDYRVKEWKKRYGQYEEFVDYMKKYTQTLKRNIQISKEGHTIIETLSSISWHNIRYFYNLLQRVHGQLGSDSNAWENSSIIAALMASTEAGEKPTLPNIFIPYKNINQAYFLKVRIIAFLSILKSGEISTGIPFNRILDFLRLYGYQSEWIRGFITECVRQRLIECLEIPSEDDSTREFISRGSETYRISPLGLLYLNQIISNPTYLSLISIDLPIHAIVEYEKLKSEFNELNSYMSDERQSVMFEEGLDVLLESNLSNITSEYLSNELQREKITSNSFLSLSEVQLTERKVKESFPSSLVKNLSDTHATPKNNGRQFNLDFETADEARPEFEFDHREEVLNMDYNFDSPPYLGSEYVPLVFCALRLKLKEGQQYCTGAEICSVINEYLVNDTNKKFPNNVSRALRSDKLLSQKWLECRADLHPKSKMFGLNDNWESCWEEVFG